MQKIKKLPSNKLCRLSSFLYHACEEFENVAKQIKEKEIKMSVRSVAVETRQYLGELNSQLKMLRVINTLPRINNNEGIKSKLVRNKKITDKKIIELCCNSEVFFEKAYGSILKEYFPYTGLRDVLRYQLKGIKDAFKQLKLLKSVMTSETTFSPVL